MRKEQISEKSQRVYGGMDHQQIVDHVLRGMDQREFIVYFQPIVCTKNQETRIIESVVRWQHPQFGLLDTCTLLKHIEQTDLLVPFGYYILRCFSQKIHQIKQHTNTKLRFSIKIAMQQLVEDGFIHYLEQTLHMYDNDFDDVMIELMETTVDDEAKLESVMFDLKDYGVRFALSKCNVDAPTLKYLDTLPVSVLKIHQHFLSEAKIGVNAKCRTLFESLVDLCHSAHVIPIADGIENETQQSKVQSMGVDMMQGQYFHEPISARLLIAALNNTSHIREMD